MKVLVLGAGARTDINDSRCHACISINEYLFYVSEAKRNGTLVTLDMDPCEEPDIVAKVRYESWADKVNEKYGDDFDVIIDAITGCYYPENPYYLSEAAMLLKPDGMFYGYLGRDKVIWFKCYGEMCMIRTIGQKYTNGTRNGVYEIYFTTNGWTTNIISTEEI
jgi:hypothetical protein